VSSENKKGILCHLLYEGKSVTIMQREFNMLQKGPFTIQMNLNGLDSPRDANETLQRVGEVRCAAGRGQREVAVR
jgi:hypothetical protein